MTGQARAARWPEQSPESGVSADGITKLTRAVAEIKSELGACREQLGQLSRAMEESAQRERSLGEAYRKVLSELADLFESQRTENHQREESVRFLLNSVEARIQNSLQNGFDMPQSSESGAPARHTKQKGRFRFWR